MNEKIDDLDGLSDTARSILIEHGRVFVTEFVQDGKRYTGNIVADNEGHAARVAEKRGHGENIVGPLVEEGDL